MSYPQPNANKYALGRQGFFRLNTQLISDGDIYETEQGAQGFAIGPDSDVSQVVIAYFDDQVDNFMNQVSISPARPFPGKIVARNEAGYSPSGTRGRILMWPAQFFNVDWRPSDFDPGASHIDFVMPVIDVVEYFSPVSLQNGQRNDRELTFTHINFPNFIAGSPRWNLVIPYYGRKYAHILFKHFMRDGVDPLNVTWGIDGLSFAPLGAGETAVTELRADAATATNVVVNELVSATTDGMFDALHLSFNIDVPDPFNNPGECLLKIILSDRED